MRAFEALVVGGAVARRPDQGHFLVEAGPVRQRGIALRLEFFPLVDRLQRFFRQERGDGAARGAPQQGVVLVLAQHVMDRMLGVELR